MQGEIGKPFRQPLQPRVGHQGGDHPHPLTAQTPLRQHLEQPFQARATGHLGKEDQHAAATVQLLGQLGIDRIEMEDPGVGQYGPRPVPQAEGAGAQHTGQDRHGCIHHLAWRGSALGRHLHGPVGEPLAQGFVGEPAAQLIAGGHVDRGWRLPIAQHAQPVPDQGVGGNHHPQGHRHSCHNL